MPHPDWNENYRTGELPWNTGRPDEHLVAAVKDGTVGLGRTLEVGCGTGTNAIWLAQQACDEARRHESLLGEPVQS